jgi:hypothetical protein
MASVFKCRRYPLTKPLIAKVRGFAGMGLSVRMAAYLSGRTGTSVESIHNVHGITVAPRPRKFTTSVTDGCWSVLLDAGKRVGDPPHRIAGGLLEMISRRRADLVDRVVLPPPAPAKSAPIQSLVHVDLQAIA